MPSAVTAVLNLSNWLAFLLGTVANILVVYLCFKVRNTEIKTLRRCLASVAVFELVECVDLSAMQAVCNRRYSYLFCFIYFFHLFHFILLLINKSFKWKVYES